MRSHNDLGMIFEMLAPTVPEAVLHYWFHEVTPAQWWKVDPAFDRLMAERFGPLHRQACQGELFEWRADPRGRLAEVIVLDQFSRNIYRGQRGAFEADPLALALAQTLQTGAVANSLGTEHTTPPTAAACIALGLSALLRASHRESR
jgi:uncharacterized protein (DUF924 family)